MLNKIIVIIVFKKKALHYYTYHLKLPSFSEDFVKKKSQQFEGVDFVTDFTYVVSYRKSEIEVVVEGGVQDLVEFRDHGFHLSFFVPQGPNNTHVEGPLLKRKS